MLVQLYIEQEQNKYIYYLMKVISETRRAH
jgi:hypothetical protein